MLVADINGREKQLTVEDLGLVYLALVRRAEARRKAKSEEAAHSAALQERRVERAEIRAARRMPRVLARAEVMG